MKRALTLVLVMAISMSPVAFAEERADAFPTLREVEIDQMLAAAAVVRSSLAELRSLRSQSDEVATAKANELGQQVQESLDSFLRAAGLTARKIDPAAESSSEPDPEASTAVIPDWRGSTTSASCLLGL